MQAIEFVTKAKDGIIEIPKKYLTNLSKEFRVIILVNEEPEKKEVRTKKKNLGSLRIKTKGLGFDRDEANER